MLSWMCDEYKTLLLASPSWTYLQDEERAEVPSRHLPLTLRPPHFLFSLSECAIKCGQHAILDLGGEVRPDGGIVPLCRPDKLYASAVGLRSRSHGEWDLD